MNFIQVNYAILIPMEAISIKRAWDVAFTNAIVNDARETTAKVTTTLKEVARILGVQIHRTEAHVINEAPFDTLSYVYTPLPWMTYRAKQQYPLTELPDIKKLLGEKWRFVKIPTAMVFIKDKEGIVVTYQLREYPRTLGVAFLNLIGGQCVGSDFHPHLRNVRISVDIGSDNWWMGVNIDLDRAILKDEDLSRCLQGCYERFAYDDYTNLLVPHEVRSEGLLKAVNKLILEDSARMGQRLGSVVQRIVSPTRIIR